MQSIKREMIDEYENHIQRKKLYIAAVESITILEDLSNDIFYEIFEYLDIDHIYKAFFNLNKRFHHVITSSILPIKINLSFISRPKFLQYHQNIIQPYQHRIISLNLRDVFANDLLFSPPRTIKLFIHLETLILENIRANIFEIYLIQHLTSMPTLRSLVVNLIDPIRNTEAFYRTIFRIPQLKYCKLTFKTISQPNTIRTAIKESSTIEHLVVYSESFLDELISVLSYLPHLRRLSWYKLSGLSFKPTTIEKLPLDNLTHLSLELKHTSFELFEAMIINLFHHLEVLHLTTGYNRDYLDADRWEQLILNYMPNLRIFDFEHRENTYMQNDVSLTCVKLNTLFTSPFWRTHQWYFNHQCFWQGNWNQIIFYSTNPYRRKKYKLYGETDQRRCFRRQERDLTTVNHVQIEGENAMMSCTDYFPNASELMLSHNFDDRIDKTIKSLTRIIPFKRLTQLHINCGGFCFSKVIDLLQFMPNLQILSVYSLTLYAIHPLSLEQSEIFQSVSKNNTIKTFTNHRECTYEQMKILLKLCPRLQHINIHMPWKDFTLLFELLFSKINDYHGNLSSLCLKQSNKKAMYKLLNLIQSNKRIDNYSIDLINRILYLWW